MLKGEYWFTIHTFLRGWIRFYGGRVNSFKTVTYRYIQERKWHVAIHNSYCTVTVHRLKFILHSSHFLNAFSLADQTRRGELIYGIERICVPNGPLFQRCQVYHWPPFSNKKYTTDLISWFICERPHFSAYIFRSDIFRGCLFFWYSIIWLRYLSNYQQLLGIKKSKGSILIRQHFGRSSTCIWMGSLFFKVGYMNGVGFEILARTPVP